MPIAARTRSGGFGGREEFRKYTKDNGIDAIIDATHPFAARISRRTAEVAASEGIPCLHVVRPPWTPGPGDRWTEIDEPAEAAAILPVGARVFLAVGRQTLRAFGPLPGRTLYCRQIDKAKEPFPWPGGEFVIGRPPFSVEEEEALFRRLCIDWLVVKNAGGEASRSKLDAARRLDLPVLMLNRPPLPPGPVVETVDAAVAWLRGLG
ncbi:MAG: precorrin-6A/cobalt-precorrin-6A reductase [Alphaproteobacteria bacterium]|nr:MAG: precorrin-6A/cobalt-precorrin-6A reductase [Alphaproteobacteria bacterium]